MPLYDRSKLYDVVCDSCSTHTIMTEYELHMSNWLVQGPVVICPEDRTKHVVRSLSRWVGHNYFHENGLTARLVGVENILINDNPSIKITLEDIVDKNIIIFHDVKEFMSSWSRTIL